jgi:hypothetical protein
MRHVAARLIAYEAKENKSPRAKSKADFAVIAKMRLQLTVLMGNGGFRALLSRALALTNAEVPGLRAVQLKVDGSFEWPESMEKTDADSESIAQGKVILLAQLLGLLVAFIGENLTLQLLHEVWPKLSSKGIDLDTGVENEKAK